MTRKDYILIANAFRSVRNRVSTDQRETWMSSVNVVAMALAKDSPSFNLPEFWGACGIVVGALR